MGDEWRGAIVGHSRSISAVTSSQHCSSSAFVCGFGVEYISSVVGQVPVASPLMPPEAMPISSSARAAHGRMPPTE